MKRSSNVFLSSVWHESKSDISTICFYFKKSKLLKAIKLYSFCSWWWAAVWCDFNECEVGKEKLKIFIIPTAACLNLSYSSVEHGNRKKTHQKIYLCMKFERYAKSTCFEIGTQQLNQPTESQPKMPVESSSDREIEKERESVPNNA